jgi:hypothetical protein
LPKPMAASGKLPNLGKAQRREHSGIEPLGDHKVAHRDGDVVYHEALTWSHFEDALPARADRLGQWGRR